MNNQDAKQVIAGAMKTAGKQQVLNAIQWLGSFGVCKQDSVYSDFVSYACEYVKGVPDEKKPSGYSVKSYNDETELVAKYVLWWAGEDIAARQA